MTVIDLFLSCRTAFWFPCFGRMSQVWTGNGLFVVSVRALVRKTHIVVMVNILSCKLFTCTYMADWLTGWVTVITIAFSSSSPVFHFNFFWWFKTAGLLPCIIYVVCLCLLQSHQSREKGCGCSSHWEREIRGRILDSSFWLYQIPSHTRAQVRIFPPWCQTVIWMCSFHGRGSNCIAVRYLDRYVLYGSSFTG